MSQIIFTPDNEPYLGRELLFEFDKMIVTTMEQNALTAKSSHDIELTDYQKMACQVIPQAISIALSIRELIRQGYLFGAYVLVRPLFERAIILFYIHHFPEDIVHWNNGWQQGEAPGLSAMLNKISDMRSKDADAPPNTRDVLKGMNDLLHAKPDSAYYNLVNMENSSVGFAASKILNRPELCDEVCLHAIGPLTITFVMITQYFKQINPNNG